MTETASEPLVVYKRLWSYTRRYWWMFLLGIVGVSVDAGTQAIFIKGMQPLIDRVLSARIPNTGCCWPDLFS
jgi:subfamily B ATP-binding cassette protein MsbA